MKRYVFLILPFVGIILAGCGTPDEQEADESEASEQESVGEGEVPGPGALGLVAAIGVASLVAAWMRRHR